MAYIQAMHVGLSPECMRVHCLAVGLPPVPSRDAANHVPWLKVRSLDLLASGRVKAALNLLDERPLEAPETLGIAPPQLAPVVEQRGRLMAVLVERNSQKVLHFGDYSTHGSSYGVCGGLVGAVFSCWLCSKVCSICWTSISGWVASSKEATSGSC